MCKCWANLIWNISVWQTKSNSLISGEFNLELPLCRPPMRNCASVLWPHFNGMNFWLQHRSYDVLWFLPLKLPVCIIRILWVQCIMGDAVEPEREPKPQRRWIGVRHSNYNSHRILKGFGWTQFSAEPNLNKTVQLKRLSSCKSNTLKLDMYTKTMLWFFWSGFCMFKSYDFL